jgi:hypothetical protein
MLVTPGALTMVIQSTQLESVSGRRFETVDPTHGIVWASLPERRPDEVGKQR